MEADVIAVGDLYACGHVDEVADSACHAGAPDFTSL